MAAPLRVAQEYMRMGNQPSASIPRTAEQSSGGVEDGRGRPAGGRALGAESGKSPPWPLKRWQIDRFLSNVDRTGGADACHPWMGACSRSGYGVVRVGKCVTRAHRVALMIRLGRPLRDGEVARHSNDCTTPACCNGAHISPGTQADNVRDFWISAKPKRGLRLTQELVAEIRERAAATSNQSAIARDLGVPRLCVRDVLIGKTWRHVPGENPPIKNARLPGRCVHGHVKPPGQRCRICNRIAASSWRERQKSAGQAVSQ